MLTCHEITRVCAISRLGGVGHCHFILRMRWLAHCTILRPYSVKLYLFLPPLFCIFAAVRKRRTKSALGRQGEWEVRHWPCGDAFRFSSPAFSSDHVPLLTAVPSRGAAADVQPAQYTTRCQRHKCEPLFPAGSCSSLHGCSTSKLNRHLKMK